MARLYQVSMRPRSGEELTVEFLATIDAQLDKVGDWLRFSAYCWLIFSEYNPTQIRDTVRLALKPDDHFLVLEVMITGADGWALPWIWEWIRKKRD